MGPMTVLTWVTSSFFNASLFVDPRLQRDKGIDSLSLDLMRISDDRRLGDRRVRHQGALDLGGSDPVTGDIDDVVDSAHEPVVAVRIFPGPVPGEIDAREDGEIRFLESLPVLDHSRNPAASRAMAS